MADWLENGSSESLKTCRLRGGSTMLMLKTKAMGVMEFECVERLCSR